MAAQLFILTRQISPHVIADAELLDQFAHTRDNEAFTELVRRHGPVVYRICRRLVGSAAADDAFQATFLLLATRTAPAKAASSIGGWLVGVASRVARQMRRTALRRSHHESTAACRASMESGDSNPDLLEQFRILDEELARLPDRLRGPVVSCLLQGHTQEHVASESGQTARTVRRRLEEAKRLLQVRLQRRGVTAVVAIALVTGLESTSAAVPARLVMQTVGVVFDFLTAGATVASPAVTLAKGVATNMFARKIMAMMVVAALGLTSLGFVLADDPQAQNPAAKVTRVQTPPVQPMLQPPQAGVAPGEPTRQVDQLAQKLKVGERQVLIEAMCVKMNEGFLDESGLRVEKPASGELPFTIAFLNPREAKMLKGLFQTTKSIHAIEILCEPKLVIPDGKPGSVKAGETIEAITYEVTAKDGEKVDTSKLKKISSSFFPSFSLEVTPTISKDEKFIELKLQPEFSQAGDQVKLTASVLAPSIHVETHNTTVVVPSSGSVAIGSTLHSHQNKTKKAEWLWLLTPHVVQGKK